jgi:hypothetical protein
MKHRRRRLAPLLAVPVAAAVAVVAVVGPGASAQGGRTLTWTETERDATFTKRSVYLAVTDDWPRSRSRAPQGALPRRVSRESACHRSQAGTVGRRASFA